jgi:hypothetical protein
MAKESGSRATTLRLLRVSSQNSPGGRIVGLERLLAGATAGGRLTNCRCCCVCGTDLRPTSVFSRRNSRRHGYLQLVAKTLYTVDNFFHAPPASDLGQFHWWSHVFEPSANFIARGCRVAQRGRSLAQRAEGKAGIVAAPDGGEGGGELLHLHLSIGVRARPDTPRPIFGVGRDFGRRAEVFCQKSAKEL